MLESSLNIRMISMSSLQPYYNRCAIYITYMQLAEVLKRQSLEDRQRQEGVSCACLIIGISVKFECAFITCKQLILLIFKGLFYSAWKFTIHVFTTRYRL